MDWLYTKLFPTVLVLTLPLLLLACAGKPDPTGTWTIYEIDGERLPDDQQLNMEINDGRISGKGPVNSWNGPLNEDSIGLVISTRMAGPPELMNREQLLLSIINNGEIDFEGTDTLVITNLAREDKATSVERTVRAIKK